MNRARSPVAFVMPMVVAAAVMAVARTASAQTATLWGAAGLGIPTGEASGPVQGADSLILDLRLAVDFGSIFQLGIGGWVFTPGVNGPFPNANTAFAAMAEGRLFPIQVGAVRPYLGLGVGYAGSAYQIKCDILCNDRLVSGPSGVVLSPLGGVRFDFPGSRRTVSLYVEGGYQGTFSSPAALDRAFVQVGPGISL